MSEEITDPSDWKQTRAPFLAAFETTLTCHICKDLMTAPVLTSCCHTFCSLCIRSSLNTDSKCPACRTGLQTSTLRKNTVMEELLEIYRVQRKGLMELLVDSDEPPKTKRRKVAAAAAAAARSDSEEIPETDQEDDELEITSIEHKTPTPTKQQDDDNSNNDPTMGQCPICQKWMKIDIIQSTHIASCLSGSSGPKPSIGKPSIGKPSIGSMASGSKFFQKREVKPEDMSKKLPFIAYNMYKEQDLRNLLQKQGIPSQGTKQQMQDRHNQWVTLWNANADSKHPNNKRVLLDQLRSWERAMAMGVKRNPEEKINTAEWSKQHQDSFAELIQRAKSSKK